MGPGRKMCVLPRGTKTIRAVVEGLRWGCGSCCRKKSSRLERLCVSLYKHTFYSYNTNFETVNLSYNDEHFVLVMKKVSDKSQTRIVRLYYQIREVRFRLRLVSDV